MSVESAARPTSLTTRASSPPAAKPAAAPAKTPAEVKVKPGLFDPAANFDTMIEAEIENFRQIDEKLQAEQLPNGDASARAPHIKLQQRDDLLRRDQLYDNIGRDVRDELKRRFNEAGPDANLWAITRQMMAELGNNYLRGDIVVLATEITKEVMESRPAADQAELLVQEALTYSEKDITKEVIESRPAADQAELLVQLTYSKMDKLDKFYKNATPAVREAITKNPRFKDFMEYYAKSYLEYTEENYQREHKAPEGETPEALGASIFKSLQIFIEHESHFDPDINEAILVSIETVAKKSNIPLVNLLRPTLNAIANGGPM